MWLCPKCGLVTQTPFLGTDKEFHCPNYDCDEVLKLEDVDHRNKRFRGPKGVRVDYPTLEKKVGRDEQAIKEGHEIVARVNRREYARTKVHRPKGGVSPKGRVDGRSTKHKPQEKWIAVVRSNIDFDEFVEI